MIFPVLELENTVQINDKTRLRAEKSFASVDETLISLIEIEPEASAGFIDVTTDKFLDWQYDLEGTKVVTVRVTTDGAPVTSTKEIEIVTPETDKLFSSDSDLTSEEPDILNYTRVGRNSFLDVHRTAQIRILAWLDEHRIWDNDGNKITKEAIIDIEEVAQWSKYMTLRIIFEGLSNANDDIFREKSLTYGSLEKYARSRGSIKVDIDGSGTIDNDEKMDLRSLTLVRR